MMISQTAALPAETLIESPEDCEEDEHKRMPFLTDEEKRKDYSCFESRLVKQDINTDQCHRVVLLEHSVYNWLSSANATSKANFAKLIEGLKPATSRPPGISPTIILRRAIIGTTTTFEVLAAALIVFEDGVRRQRLVLLTPFVGGEIDGVTNFGVLIWAIVPEQEASLYKVRIRTRI